MSSSAIAGEVVSALISGMKPLGSALPAEFRARWLVFFFPELCSDVAALLLHPEANQHPPGTKHA